MREKSCFFPTNPLCSYTHTLAHTHLPTLKSSFQDYNFENAEMFPKKERCHFSLSYKNRKQDIINQTSVTMIVMLIAVMMMMMMVA